MAPKKGKKKVQDDDWEAELGESIVPQAEAAAEPQPEEAAGDDDAMGGGLMAALQRRGKKKNKKGANAEVEGEDPPAEAESAGFEDKAPQEANFDDDDVFAGNYGKKKGKGGAAAAVAQKADEPATPPADDGPRVKTKAEKEREKKEKEKQRKKELVSCVVWQDNYYGLETNSNTAGREEEGQCSRKDRNRCPR
jgi:translation initiation factor 5B